MSQATSLVTSGRPGVGGWGIGLGVLEGLSGLLLLSGIALLPHDEATVAAFISGLVAAVFVSAGVASCRKCVAGFYVLLGLSTLYLVIALMSLIAGVGFVGIIPAMIALYLFNTAPRAIAHSPRAGVNRLVERPAGGTGNASLPSPPAGR